MVTLISGATLLLLLATVGHRATAFVPAKSTMTSTYSTRTLSTLHLLVMPEHILSSTDVTASMTAADVIASSSHFLASRLFNAEVKDLDPDDARAQFFFYFFAGSGAGGIGLAQIPKLFTEIQQLQALSQEVGPSRIPGGKVLKTGPLVSFFYRAPLYEQDVLQVISKIPNDATNKIVAQGTSTTYMASMGYVVQSDFVAAVCGGRNGKNYGNGSACNPYAASAVFEAMTGGRAKCVQPDDVDAKTKLYKSTLTSGGGGDDDDDDVAAGLQAMVKDLQGAATTRLGAIGTLAFLLFLILSLIVESGLQAFT
jgi:hypothetical protein